MSEKQLCRAEMMDFNWFECMTSMTGWLVDTLNSSFGIALVGAFFGAFAANYFARRSERNLRLHERLLASNAATSFAIATFQHALGFKEQLARPLITQYENDRERYVQFLTDAKAGKLPETKFEVEYNFGNISLFRHNAEEIEKLVVRDAGAEQRVIMAAAFLVQTLNSLKESVDQRSVELARLAAAKGAISDDEFAHSFFGVADTSGNIDERLLDCMRTIELQLDGAIFYSKLIAEKLGMQNSSLATMIGKGAPDPIKLSFDEARAGHLLPDPAEFPDWIDSNP